MENGTSDLAAPSSTWDEFPNGRFGDPTSPAYGVGSGDQWDGGAGGLGVSVSSRLTRTWSYLMDKNLMQRPEAIAQWGTPTTGAELTAIFVRHLKSDPRTPSTPFSPDPLLSETALVLPHLLKMAERGYWTVGSQPAADCVPSTDDILGWGPPGGYVFQKPFVEFFCDEETMNRLEAKTGEAGSWVTLYAANAHVSNRRKAMRKKETHTFFRTSSSPIWLRMLGML